MPRFKCFTSFYHQIKQSGERGAVLISNQPRARTYKIKIPKAEIGSGLSWSYNKSLSQNKIWKLGLAIN